MYKVIGVLLIAAVLLSVAIGGSLFISYKKTTDIRVVPPPAQTTPEVPLQGDLIYGDPRDGIMPCTQEAKRCPDGSFVSRHGPECAFDVCPHKKAQKHPVNFTDEELLCPDVYAPVCAQPPMPACQEGMNCIQVMPMPKTFSNACYAHSVGAEVLSEGACDDDVQRTVPGNPSPGVLY